MGENAERPARPKTTALAPACASAWPTVRSTSPLAMQPAPNFAAGDVKTSQRRWPVGLRHRQADGSVQPGRVRQHGLGNAEGKGWLVGGLVPVGAGEIRLAYSRYKVDVGLGEPGNQEGWPSAMSTTCPSAPLCTPRIARVKNKGGASRGSERRRWRRATADSQRSATSVSATASNPRLASCQPRMKKLESRLRAAFLLTQTRLSEGRG